MKKPRGHLSFPDEGTQTAAHKVLWKNEQHSVRLRAEFFNITNQPNFQIPLELELFNSRLGCVGSAGRITDTSTASRQIQLVLRRRF